MPHFKNKEEWNKFLNGVREFALGTLLPIARKADRESHLPGKEIIVLLREKGLWNCGRPERYGGMGLSFSEYWRVVADIALAGRSIAMLFHGRNTGNWRLIDRLGTEEQKERYWGEKLLNFCLTERDAGTGKDIKTYAVRRGDRWYLNGEKHLISYANLVDAFGVIAWSNRDEEEISLFMVKRDAPGFYYKPMGNSMGCRGSIHGILRFEEAEVPAEDVFRIGGFQFILEFLDISRTSIAAQSLGISRRCYELAIDYSKQRKTFGKLISERQAIQSMMAEMAIYLYALENSINDTGQKIDLGEPVRREAASCKRLAIETLRRVTDNALFIHGGRGYWDESPLEMLYRDARALWFEEGTPQIQEMAVAREVLKQPKWW
jgi:alkylation response protein AidB-like acyl-CoA dehydrogenase